MPEEFSRREAQFGNQSPLHRTKTSVNSESQCEILTETTQQGSSAMEDWQAGGQEVVSSTDSRDKLSCTIAHDANLGT